MPRPSRARSDYGHHYRHERERLLAPGPPCVWCGATATTADHDPPLATHDHHDGTGCCVLVPACGPCNSGRGARLGAERRNDPLRPGRGWSARG